MLSSWGAHPPHLVVGSCLSCTSQLWLFFGFVSLPPVLMLGTLQLLGEAQQPVAQFWKAACG